MIILDQDLKRQVEAELRWDPCLNESDIGVSVKNATVTLSGFVHSYSDKHDAEVAAKRIAGVAGVANDIEVRLPTSDQRPDPEIARDVVAGIQSQLFGTEQTIKPVVSNGGVVLEGEVDWHYQRERAENMARCVRGVRTVTNRIKLRSRPAVAEIKGRIEEALKRSAVLEARAITVESHDGDVVLKGQVHSWAERQEADRAAWAAAGVKKVDNRLSVTH